MESSFAPLGVNDWLCKAVRSMGYIRPTPIQQQCIPHILKGGDVIGRARTGSGKTACFALPILQELASDPYGVFALVLTPTRELAYQIADQFRAFGTNIGLKDCVIVGGLDMGQQATELSRRPHVIIATPGRLAHHLASGCAVHLEHLRYLVLDEADRLFEESFKEDLMKITEALPPREDRQTLLFSATMTKKLVAEHYSTMAHALYFEVDSEDRSFVDTLDQKYVFMPQHVKEVYLAYILQNLPDYKDKPTIVFCATRRGCEVIAQLFAELSIECVTLHSGINQQRRLAGLGKFKSGRSKLLVATDVASRGLDIPTVQLVINYDVPRLIDDYIHRVGRTARAGRGGLALSLVSQYDIELLKQVEERVGKQLQELELEEGAVLKNMSTVQSAYKMAKLRIDEFELSSKRVKSKRPRKGGKGEEGGEGGEEKGGAEDGGVKEKLVSKKPISAQSKPSAQPNQKPSDPISKPPKPSTKSTTSSPKPTTTSTTSKKPTGEKGPKQTKVQETASQQKKRQKTQNNKPRT